MVSVIARPLILFLTVVAAYPAASIATEPGLVGHWKLQGDCRDHSGHDNHGVNHGVDLETGSFDGRQAYIEVPASDSLKLGASDFTISARIYTAEHLDDIVGDVVEMYDPEKRRGITLAIKPSAGGYQSQGTDRHVQFGIDNDRLSDWQDCGKPNPTSNYIANSLTVFDGKLYAATIDAADEAGWSHVYCYEGGQKWTDCGRVGDGKATGVLPMIVHNGSLIVATSTYDWTRVRSGDYEPGRVYRYLGGQRWEDLGQPSDNRTWNGMASYKGKLYIGGGPQHWAVYVLEDDGQWKLAKEFDKESPQRCYPHAMSLYNGKLYVGYPGVWEFDGQDWKFVGDPAQYGERHSMLQTHSLDIYQGKLIAGTFPEAIVSTYLGGDAWEPMGRVGVDGTETMGLVVYNGQLYGSSLPRAEVCRYEGDSQWTSLKRFHSPEGWEPRVPPNHTREQINEMNRVTSLTVHDGRLFAGTGSCTSAHQDSSLDVLGRVFSIEAGKMASYDKDLGAGWKHLTAVRRGSKLQIYIDGKLAAESTAFDPAEYDLSTDRPLRIGLGQSEYFAGRMADVCLYSLALSNAEIEKLALQSQ